MSILISTGNRVDERGRINPLIMLIMLEGFETEEFYTILNVHPNFRRMKSGWRRD